MRENHLIGLALVFAPFSLTAFGGGLSVVSGIQQQAVDVQGWLTSQEFINLFAISRAAPGPGSMLAALIGWHVAGLNGALVATAAMFLPSSILCAVVAVIWRTYHARQWLKILESAIEPIGVGLLLAGVLVLTPMAATTSAAIIIGLLSTAICFFRPTTHPVAILGLGAAANVLASVVTT